jgi:hypothetical protein
VKGGGGHLVLAAGEIEGKGNYVHQMQLVRNLEPSV